MSHASRALYVVPVIMFIGARSTTCTHADMRPLRRRVGAPTAPSHSFVQASFCALRLLGLDQERCEEPFELEWHHGSVVRNRTGMASPSGGLGTSFDGCYAITVVIRTFIHSPNVLHDTTFDCVMYDT